MAGRRPKPTALKVLAGNPGHRPLNSSEPKPELLASAEVPKGLGRIARREWNRVVPLLIKNGLLTALDEKVLIQYVKAFEASEIFYKVYMESPMITEPILNKQGEIVGEKVKTNPAFDKYCAATKIISNYASHFGLSAMTRGRLHVDPGPKKDPVEQELDYMPPANSDADIMQVPSLANN